MAGNKKYQQAYRDSHKEQTKARSARWYQANKERSKESSRAKYHKNAPALKIKRVDLKKAALQAYGGEWCQCCGEKHIEFLTIDHLNGNGAAHRKQMGGSGNSLYQWLKQHSYPLGFRVLCLNCNGSLGFNGYCPHERKSL